jgi:preprotein translocase YajC subunit
MDPFVLVLLYALGLFLLFYCFSVVPGRKKHRQMVALHEGIKPGDEVVTVGGFIATVLSRSGDELVIRLDEHATARVMIFAVQSVRTPAQAE